MKGGIEFVKMIPLSRDCLKDFHKNFVGLNIFILRIEKFLGITNKKVK